MNSPKRNDRERLTQVESLLSHLQHDIDKLNDALIDQQRQVDELRTLVLKLESAVEQFPDSPRDPREERPPHY
jgi:uncharacterized coiled-coil protein SlyX